ncbi:unnamed protein product [Cylicocyclus nassatus]|uniref:GATA-type domain-containing protein n=1 Tax=Cylicocyclus nassatus TaxID=53992 RepID=A0AA36HHM7_CYLNA|nr:unnamed protein product [Cylicocyclus nassatus]
MQVKYTRTGGAKAVTLREWDNCTPHDHTRNSFVSDDELDYEDGLCDNCGEICRNVALQSVDEVKLCYVCRMYYKLIRKHRPCSFTSASVSSVKEKLANVLKTCKTAPTN